MNHDSLQFLFNGIFGLLNGEEHLLTGLSIHTSFFTVAHRLVGQGIDIMKIERGPHLGLF
jgi:hypothetical protein